jgi:hypothetical protein
LIMLSAAKFRSLDGSLWLWLPSCLVQTKFWFACLMS